MNIFYITRMVVDAEGVRVPKYIANLNLTWRGIDYGAENAMLVYVSNIDQATHDSIIVNADIIAAPENIDINLTSGAISVLTPIMELLNIPADWLNVSYSYRDVIKIVAGIFRFNQRYGGIEGGRDNIIEKASNNLELQYKLFPLNVKQKLSAAADSFDPPLDSSNITGNSTVRFILYELGKQFLTRPLSIGISI